VEKSVNELRHYLNCDDPVLASLGCALLAYVAKLLRSNGKHYNQQIAIILKNFMAAFNLRILKQCNVVTVQMTKEGPSSRSEGICNVTCIFCISAVLQHFLSQNIKILPPVIQDCSSLTKEICDLIPESGGKETVCNP
jgi:hypothetical protein